MGHEGAGEGDALLLAAAELHGVVRGAVEEADLIEQLAGPGHAVAKLACEFVWEEDIFLGGERGDELVALEDEADFGAANPCHVVFCEVGDVCAIEKDAAGSWGVETSEQAEQGALAAAGGPHDGDELAMWDGEADSLEDLHQVCPGFDFAGDCVNFDCKRIRHEGLLFSILTVVTRISFFAIIFVVTVGLGSCAKKRMESAESTDKLDLPVPMAALPPPDTRKVVLCFGDSITAGFGLEAGKTYPDYLQKIIDTKGYKYRVINSGISGDTTQGGLDRMADAVRLAPKVTLLELGGNDGLRGIPVHRTRDSLTQIAGRFEAKGSKILLLGITLPLNYGPDYIRDFEFMFKGLATNHHYAFMPFILDGVWNLPGAMQADNIHPTSVGAEIVAKNVFKHLEPLLER